MVFQDDSSMIVESAKSTKLSCLENKSSPSVQQCFHSSCPNCDVNYLKTLNTEIKQITNETESIKSSSQDNKTNLSSSSLNIPFETQRLHFYAIIEEWKNDRMGHVSFIYQKKKNQIDLICSQTYHEYETFKIEQKNLLNEHLLSSHHQHNNSHNNNNNNNNNNNQISIPNEIDELNQKLSLTRHLLDYFIQPKLHNRNSFSDEDENDDDDDNTDDDDDDDDDEDQSLNYEEIFRQKPINEYSLSTDNLAMACSNSNVLLRDGARLILYNEKEKLHQLEIKVQHPGDFIRDLCWCETLGYYLVLTQYLLFIYDPEKYSLTIVDKVKPIERSKFSSLTCSDNILFLVNGNGQCVERWSIAKSFNWKLIKRWADKEFCRDNFRLTSRIRANHMMLALNICGVNFGYRICLYDYHMKLLRRINSDSNLHLLSYMNGNLWMATDYKERFYSFNDDETIKTVMDYTGKGGYIRNIARLGSNYIAVKVQTRLQVYKI